MGKYTGILLIKKTYGHPHKMFRFPLPDRPIFLEK